MVKRTLLGIAFVVMAGLFSASGAQAITIIPPSLEFEAAPGQTYETSVKLFNETEEVVVLYTEATNFGAAGESGRPAYTFGVEPEGLSSWITVDEGPFELQPGDRITVPIQVTPPDNAGPGGHYAAVFFSDTPPSADSGQISVGTKIGILLLARIPGDVIESGLVKEFIVDDATSLGNRLPLTFVTRFENDGNVHLRPTGSIEITNMMGNGVASLSFNPSNGATLPNTIRKYETIWQKATAVDGSGFWAEFQNERNNFAIGKYTATVTLAAGVDTKLSDAASVTFVIVPWRVILVWGFGIVIILALLWMFLRHYKKIILKKAANTDSKDKK